MKIAIFSDIHDAKSNLNRALARVQDTERLLVLGDLCSPFIIHELGKGYSQPIDIVFGNNDGDLFRIATNAASYPHMKLHGEFAELQLGNLRIALNHFDSIGRALSKGAYYDVVAFGHNHQYECGTLDNGVLLINPGEIYGGISGSSTFVVLDSETKETLRIDL